MTAAAKHARERHAGLSRRAGQTMTRRLHDAILLWRKYTETKASADHDAFAIAFSKLTPNDKSRFDSFETLESGKGENA